MRLASLLTVIALSAVPGFLRAQETANAAQKIYQQAAESVLLIETRDAGNQATGQATAFVVGPGLLLTNAHAVAAPSVWVRVGAVALQASVERTDQLNDLALLRVAGELALPSLVLASQAPGVGSRIFAIGDPRGLERTISEGLATGIRTIEGRSLLQISAPISPGSSGGPILDDKGTIVGVAVGSLTNAQNLNFVVPAAVVSAFLTNKPALDATSDVERARQLLQERRQIAWSDEENSRYQQVTKQIQNLLTPNIGNVRTEETLAALAADLTWTDSELALIVARQRVAVGPKNGTALAGAAEAVRDAAIFEEGTAEQNLYREAEKYATQALAVASSGERRQRLLLLGQIQTSLDDKRQTGIATLRQAVGAAKDETAYDAALALFGATRQVGQSAEAKKWFEFASSIREVQAYYYNDYARLLEDEGAIEASASAYLVAARVAYKYRCDAARLFRLIDRDDDALSHARACLEAASKATNGNSTAEWAHRILSITLLDRGVTDQAISHARQAIAIDGESGFAFSALASALVKAERWSEAESAARSGIRLTDGAHADMHFELGQALFGQERWSEAKNAFEQAAKMEPTNSAASYNVAICLVRLRFYRDAAEWYEETLRRDPKRSDAAELRRRIQTLRQ